MAKSYSNINYEFFLDVSVLPPDCDERQVFISITAPRFPNRKIINLMRSNDQQLVSLDQLIDEFISDSPLIYDNNEDCIKEKLSMAESLEIMARKIRDSLK